MTYGITPKSWDGTSIDTDDYMAQFVEDSQSLDNTPAQAVRSTRPGRTPLHSYMQPAEKHYVLEIVILGTMTQTKYDTVAGWFDTIAGAEHTLIVTDGDSTDRRIACVVEGFTVSGIGNNVFKVNLSSDEAIQVSDTAADDTPILLDSPTDTFTLTNDGNTGAPLVLTLSPEAAIDEDDGYHLGRRIYLANRSEQALTHFAAEGYAIEITDGGLDTATLEGADKVLDSLDDLRVWLNGRELLRWCDPETSDAATKIWCNIAMRPGRFASLAADISDDDEVITIDSIDGFEGWDRQGFIYIGNEPCIYEIVDDFTATITRLSGASHSAGATITWIEHVLTLTYGWTAADTPPAGLDSKPVIDLSASSNTQHEWPGPFFNDNDRRSMTWRRIVEGDQSPHIRGWDDGDNMVFEDLLPETGKPLADSVEVRFPVPCVGPLELDRSVDVGIGLHGFAADLDGFESQLIEVLSGDVSDDTYALDNEMTRLCLKAFISAITGEVGTLTSSDPFAVGPAYAGPGRNGSNDTLDLYARVRMAIHFTLDQDTEIREFIIQTDSGDSSIGFEVTSEDRTTFIWAGAFVVGSDGDWSAGGIAAVFPAGSYWIILDTTASGNLLTKQRSKARLFSSSILLPDDYAYEDTGLTTIHYSAGVPVLNNSVNYPGYAGFGYFDVFPGFHTPLFGVISVKQDPQADAPLQSGNTISIDNVIAPLDDTRSPLIVMGSEFSLFPIIGTLTNNETGDVASFSFLCKATESLTIDFDSALVTDDETGLPADYALQCSNPTRRLYLAKGDNEFAIAIPGVSASAKLDVTPTYRHAWL